MSDPTRDPNEIEVGDTVTVHFEGNNPSIFDAKVLYRPCATGDCWHLREESGVVSQLHYVQNFAVMTLVVKAE